MTLKETFFVEGICVGDISDEAGFRLLQLHSQGTTLAELIANANIFEENRESESVRDYPISQAPKNVYKFCVKALTQELKKEMRKN